jgi:hypothetical protein
VLKLLAELRQSAADEAGFIFTPEIAELSARTYSRKIVFVGTDQQMRAYRGPSTQAINAGGHLVLPGFTDAHAHFIGGSTAIQTEALIRRKQSLRFRNFGRGGAGSSGGSLRLRSPHHLGQQQGTGDGGHQQSHAESA